VVDVTCLRSTRDLARQRAGALLEFALTGHIDRRRMAAE
jgi:hypothetical protein